jgi:hypothetical protein
MADGKWFDGRWNDRWQILPPSGATSNSVGPFPAGVILEKAPAMESRIISERAFASPVESSSFASACGKRGELHERLPTNFSTAARLSALT